MAALVSPTGQRAVTARLPRPAVPALSPAGGAFADEWLPTIGAVRTPLARVDVHQLAAGTDVGSGPALACWTNKPADPWQRDDTDTRRLVVGFAAATLDLAAVPAGGRVAAAVLDRLTEVIPAREQTTRAAFGFDASAARAPQAILLAVPPDPGKPLDDDALVAILAETRAFARARVTRPADLDEGIRGLLPTVLLPAAGATRVPLEREG